MIYSVSSYSFQQYIKSGKMTQIDSVEKAKELGFDAVEFTPLTPDINKTPSYEEQVAYAAEIRKKADECDIKISAYTIGATLFHEEKKETDAEIERLCKQLDIAKMLGAPILRHDAIWNLGKTGRSRAFDLMLPDIAKNIRSVSDYAQTLGIKTCVENHGIVAQDSCRMERLFCAVNHENFGLLVDIGNFVCVDENPVTAVSRVAPYAIHVHIKDMIVSPGGAHDPGTTQTRGCNYFRGTIVGQGSVPVKQCIKILQKAGYNSCYTIEFEGPEDCIAALTKGFDNLKKYFAN